MVLCTWSGGVQGSNNENLCKVAKEEITKGGCRNAKSVLSAHAQCACTKGANFVFQKCSIFAPRVQILSGSGDSQSVTIVQALSNTLYTQFICHFYFSTFQHVFNAVHRGKTPLGKSYTSHTVLCSLFICNLKDAVASICTFYPLNQSE